MRHAAAARDDGRTGVAGGAPASPAVRSIVLCAVVIADTEKGQGMEQHDGSLVLVVYTVASFYLVVSVLTSALIGYIFGEEARGVAMGIAGCVLARSFCCRAVRSKKGHSTGNTIHPGNDRAAGFRHGIVMGMR